MTLLTDNALDSGLSYLVTNGSRIDLCSSEPATYTAATSTLTLANKTGLTLDAIANHTSGRKTTVPAITDGSVTGTGTATHWALSKVTATTELLATTTLTASQALTSGNTFTLDAIIIAIPDPA